MFFYILFLLRLKHNFDLKQEENHVPMADYEIHYNTFRITVTKLYYLIMWKMIYNDNFS